jgi:hypothetical protein
MAQAPAPDGRHDDLEDDELEGLALLVPDDPRSLEGDRLAYLRELQTARDAGLARWRRPFRSGPPGTGLLGTGLAGPAILVLLVVVGLIGSTLSVFGSSATSTRALSPLASDDPALVGSVGGLLPDAQVLVKGTPASLRSARPAVLVMVPADCPGCSDLLPALRAQAKEYNLGFVLVGPRSQATQLADLARESLASSATVLIDPTDAVRAAYDPSGVTVVAVHTDGVVAAVWRDVQPDQRLETTLVQLESPGARAA